MIKKLLLLSLLLTAIKSHGQSLFEDGSGEAIILRNSIGAHYNPWFNLRISTATESFTMSYVHMKDLKAKAKANRQGYTISKSSFWGTDVKIDMEDGKGGILSAGALNVGMTFSGMYGIQRERYLAGSSVFTNPVTKYVRLGLTHKKHTLLDTLAFKKNDVKNTQAFLTFHHNNLFRGFINKKPVYHMLGFSFGYKGTNNLNDLDDGLASEIIKTNGDFTIREDIEGKVGDLKRYDSFPLKVDYGFIPPFLNNRVGFNFYSRVKFNMPSNPINLGLGTFFTKEDEPTNVIGGIGWQFNDIGNKKGMIKNSSVFVYIGYTID